MNEKAILVVAPNVFVLLYNIDRLVVEDQVDRLTTAPKILCFRISKMTKQNAQPADPPYAHGRDKAYRSYIFAMTLGAASTSRLPDWVWDESRSVSESTRLIRLRFEVMYFYTGLAAKHARSNLEIGLR